MKVALISDPHRNLRSHQAEAHRVLDSLPEDLRRRQVDLILVSGDIYEEPPTQEEEDDCARWLHALSDCARVVAITGNHDIGCRFPPRLRVPCSETHAPRHPITIFDRPGVVHAAGCAVACLPWPRTGHLLAATEGAGAEQRYAAGVAALRDVLLGLGAELEQHDGPRILLAHAHVRGARLGQHVPSRSDFNLGLEDLALAGPDLVGLGHLHEFQHWTWMIDGRDVPMLYAGSPFANTWGETERKGYVVIDVVDSPKRGRPEKGSPIVGWEFIPTIARPLVRPTATFAGGSLTVHTGQVENAAVQIRCRVPADQRDAAKRAAEAERDRLVSAGAAHVEIDLEIEPVVRARAPEITGKSTPADKLEVWLRAQGQGVDDSRVERLRGMVTSLEVESQ